MTRMLCACALLCTAFACSVAAPPAAFYTAQPPPYITPQGVGMVPLTPITRWLGATCAVGPSDGRITLTLGPRTVVLTCNAVAGQYNGNAVTLSAAPVERYGVLYVPLRAIIDGLHIATDWSDRWLQATLHHPTSGALLAIGLTDPDDPSPNAVLAAARRGTYRITDLHELGGYPLAMFILNNGKLLDNNAITYGQYRTRDALKCYSLTRYLGLARSYKDKSGQTGLSPNAAGEPVIGISGDWNAMPRPPHIEDPQQPIYQQAVRELLDQHGMQEMPVSVEHVYRVDLNGDGEEAVLLSAASGPCPGSAAQSPYYSLVAVGHITGTRCEILECRGMFTMKGTDNYTAYSIAGLLDVNGDGLMEVVLAQDSGGHARTASRFTGKALGAVAHSVWGE